MKTDFVLIGLGSNLGDRLENLRRAQEALRAHLQILKTSRVYLTEPWGYADQPAFLNQVLLAKTDLPPHALLDAVKAIELELGRKPTFRYGPRVIDIDILAYGNLVLKTPRLTIPHPRLAERAFVLVPLAEIAPDWRHPDTGLIASEMLAKVGAEGVKPFTGSEEERN